MNERKRNGIFFFFYSLTPKKGQIGLCIIIYNTNKIIIKNEKLTHFKVNSRIRNSVQILRTHILSLQQDIDNNLPLPLSLSSHLLELNNRFKRSQQHHWCRTCQRGGCLCSDCWIRLTLARTCTLFIKNLLSSR